MTAISSAPRPVDDPGGAYDHPVRAVMYEVPPDILDYRERLGLDRWDEMWDGVLHMVPPPSEGHQGLGSEIFAVLHRLARGTGLSCRYETGLFDPEAEGNQNYRTPDLVVFRPEHRVHRGVEGGAELAFEIRSPRDESWDKLDFYADQGVKELVIIEPWAAQVHRLVLTDSELVLRDDGAGRVALVALPLVLVPEPEVLRLVTPDADDLVLTWDGQVVDDLRPG